MIWRMAKVTVQLVNDRFQLTTSFLQFNFGCSKHLAVVSTQLIFYHLQNFILGQVYT